MIGHRPRERTAVYAALLLALLAPAVAYAGAG